MRSFYSRLLIALLGLCFALPLQAQTKRHHSTTRRGHARPVHVRSYTRHTKTGKSVHVKGYNRRRPHHR